MKSKLCTGSSLLMFVLLLVSVACNKADHPDSESADDVTNATPLTSLNNTTAAGCPHAPDYGDSVVYLQPKNAGDFTVEPKNNTGVPGTYVSWPEGLDMNANTGVINVSNSETGVRYNIAFVKKGTRDTCVSQLIVGGVTYVDSIYVLSNND
ncbi:MAG TPA: hypothetical protein VM187_03010, partial [Niastella sp.]|nr:hypothetical protein [Niastella sp.]